MRRQRDKKIQPIIQTIGITVPKIIPRILVSDDEFIVFVSNYSNPTSIQLSIPHSITIIPNNKHFIQDTTDF